MADRLTPEQLEELAATYDPKRADWCGNACLHMSCGGCAYKVVTQAALDARTVARVQAWTETPGDARVKSQVAALLRAEDD